VLGRSLLSSAIPSLREALGDPYWQVQKEAIASLARLNARAATDELIAFLSHEVADLRRAAALALGELRSPRALRPLADLSGDADVEVRKAAERAIHAIGRTSRAEESL
jgi:HEAT repeat protein